MNKYAERFVTGRPMDNVVGFIFKPLIFAGKRKMFYNMTVVKMSSVLVKHNIITVTRTL